MPTLSIEEVQLRLPQIIHELHPGEELVITSGDRPVARLLGEGTVRQPRKAGNCQGLMVIVADDDDHLQDFAEYME